MSTLYCMHYVPSYRMQGLVVPDSVGHCAYLVGCCVIIYSWTSLPATPSSVVLRRKIEPEGAMTILGRAGSILVWHALAQFFFPPASNLKCLVLVAIYELKL